jgi:hypothetical protein
MTGSDPSRFPYSFVNAVLYEHKEFHSDSLRILDDSSMTKNGIHLCLSSFLAIRAKSSQALLLFKSIRTW